MGVIKVKFKDGSTADIPDSLKEKALAKGAVVVNEASAPKIGGTILMKFQDGSTANIPQNLKDKALAKGAVVVQQTATPKAPENEGYEVKKKIYLSRTMVDKSRPRNKTFCGLYSAMDWLLRVAVARLANRKKGQVLIGGIKHQRLYLH